MKLLWHTFTDHRPRLKPWSVFIVDRITYKGSTAWDGLTIPDAREILIRRGTAERMIEVHGHELSHVIRDGSDHPSAIADYHREILDAVDEYAARRAECALWPVMASFGAQIPPFPPGFKPKRQRKQGP